MHKYIGNIIAILLLVGCSATGEDKFSSSYVKAHIISNKTTQAEVQAIYGVPDRQSVFSDGVTSWQYEKSGNLKTASSIVNYIPGAGAISSALGIANTASDTSDKVTKASSKMTGDTELRANTLYIQFDSKGIVDSWNM